MNEIPTLTRGARTTTTWNTTPGLVRSHGELCLDIVVFCATEAYELSFIQTMEGVCRRGPTRHQFWPADRTTVPCPYSPGGFCRLEEQVEAHAQIERLYGQAVPLRYILRDVLKTLGIRLSQAEVREVKNYCNAFDRLVNRGSH